MKTTVVVATLALVAAGGLAGCSSSSSSPEASAAPTPEGSMVGGMATCDEATFTTDVEALLKEQGGVDNLYSIDGFQCVDGWAVVFPTIGGSEDTAYTYTQVFQAEGQFWIPKDRGDVCGTQDPNDATAYPVDSQVPEAIYQDACNTN